MTYLKYITTGSVLAFSIAQLNLWLTAIVLILTITYWVQKNIKEYKGKNNE